jgi:IclR family KDG regulon transcriptional repressor
MRLKFHWMKPSAKSYSSQLLDRAVQILSCFTLEEDALRLVDIAQRTGLHKSTCYRLLESLRAHHLLGFDEESGRYYPGMRLFEMGMLAVERLKLDKFAHPLLEELARETGETAHLCVLDSEDVVYIAKVECNHTLRIPSHVGTRNPAHSTGVGKALLAYLEPQKLVAFLERASFRQFTKRTIVSRSELSANLGQVRTLGYAIDDQEREDGVRCVAAPIRDYSGKVIAALSIAGPSMRITKERIPELARQVMQAAGEISASLGYGALSNGSGKSAARKDLQSRGAAESRPAMKVATIKSARSRSGRAGAKTRVL